MRCLFVFALLLLLGCQQQPAPLYLPEGENYPEKLSDWGQLQRSQGFIAPIAEALPYDLNTPLFTDYAHKLRTVWMPAGTSAGYGEAHFDYPLGTVISKTFYYPKDAQGRLLQHEQDVRDPQRGLELARVQLIETRLLLKQKNGWVALPYVWDEQQQDARLEWAGDSRALSLLTAQGNAQSVDYQVPDANQCAGCHEESAGQGNNPLGPKARHLNKPLPTPMAATISCSTGSSKVVYKRCQRVCRACRAMPCGRRRARTRAWSIRRAVTSTPTAVTATTAKGRDAPPACCSTRPRRSALAMACANNRWRRVRARVTGWWTSTPERRKSLCCCTAWKVSTPAS